jgi:protein tyrosine/serine phosphatase
MPIGDRHLAWTGLFNVRDLGGLSTTDGRLTRRGAIVRSDSLGRLELRGWEELEAYGIRTIVDLRNESELGNDAAPRPASIETVNIPLDVTEDRDFWESGKTAPSSRRRSITARTSNASRSAAPKWSGRSPGRDRVASSSTAPAAATAPARPRCWCWTWSESSPRRSPPTTG